jgi:hypothetical protein
VENFTYIAFGLRRYVIVRHLSIMLKETIDVFAQENIFQKRRCSYTLVATCEIIPAWMKIAEKFSLLCISRQGWFMYVLCGVQKMSTDLTYRTRPSSFQTLSLPREIKH